MVILAAVQSNFVVALLSATTLVLGAGYTLWMYKRVIFGEVGNRNVASMQDINHREFFILMLLAIAVLFMGLCPNFISHIINLSSQHLLETVAISKI